MIIPIKDSIEIKTTPEKIFNFFFHIEENYRAWHPQDHVKFSWIKGKPMEEGSVGFFEEYLHGKIHKMSAKYTRILPNKEVEFKVTNPIWRIFYPKGLMTIEQKGDHCIFTAINYFRLGPLSSKSKFLKNRFKAVKKHMKEEGENLKKILENE
ncbi:MAG: hypothetical protein NWF08_05580 [Candidatus Bathyarchaeota archaeon]|nr:hypothetical protein [Candidatus Bathyarchaeota archaeon]